MAHTVRVLARSRDEVQLKIYMDRAAYDTLYGYSRTMAISVVDLVRMVLAERFPDAPSMDLRVEGLNSD